jgi:hypothetical protein
MSEREKDPHTNYKAEEKVAENIIILPYCVKNLNTNDVFS